MDHLIIYIPNLSSVQELHFVKRNEDAQCRALQRRLPVVGDGGQRVRQDTGQEGWHPGADQARM